MQVSATTLDDVWFPLIKKKGLNKKPVAAQASMLSDLSAKYKIVPRSSQVSQATEVNLESLLVTSNNVNYCNVARQDQTNLPTLCRPPFYTIQIFHNYQNCHMFLESFW